MTAQPRRHRDREPVPAASPRRASDPPPPGDAIAAGTVSRAGPDSHSGLASSVDEATRLTGPSRSLLHEQMRLGNLAHLKVDRRQLITRQPLPQFLGIAS
jgi:hypothetical protein